MSNWASQSTPPKVYPIQRVAASYVIDEAEVACRSDGSLWKLQQAIAKARFDMLQKMIEEDMVTVPGRDRVSIEVRIERSCVPAEVGDVPAMPDTMYHYATVERWGGR